MKTKDFPGRITSLTPRGHFLRVGYELRGHTRFRYYWRSLYVRVPWIVWAMFS